MAIFARRKPNSPRESNTAKATNQIIFVGIIFCTLVSIRIIVAYVAPHFGEKQSYILFNLSMKTLTNIHLPILYINSIPNLKEYSANFVSKYISHPFINLINYIFNFLASFKPTVRIYPKIEQMC